MYMRQSLSLSIVLAAILALTITSTVVRAAPVALAEFDTLTVTFNGPGLNHLDFQPGIDRASSFKKATATGAPDDIEPLMGFNVPSTDARVALANGPNALAQIQDHVFTPTGITFENYIAKAFGNVSAEASALGSASLNFVIVGQPALGDTITIGYAFTGENILVQECCEASLTVNTTGGFDNRFLEFDQNDTINIPPVTVDLAGRQPGTVLGLSVSTKAFASVPEPGTIGLLATGILLIFRRRRKFGPLPQRM